MDNTRIVTLLEEGIASLKESIDALNGIISSCDAITEQIRSAIAEADE